MVVSINDDLNSTIYSFMQQKFSYIVLKHEALNCMNFVVK
jgi:hypothetical protein